MRNSYLRELLKQKNVKSGSSARNRKQYVFFNQLNFLQTVVKNTTSSLTEETTTDVNDINGSDEETEVCAAKPIPQIRKFTSKQKEIEEEKDLLKVIKNKISGEQQPQITYDEETMFLLSLVPELKKIPENFKFDVKMEIMNVFKKAKLQMQQSSQYDFPSSSQQFNSVHPFTQNVFSQAQVHHQPLNPYINSASRTSTAQPLPSPAESHCSQYTDTSFIDFN